MMMLMSDVPDSGSASTDPSDPRPASPTPPPYVPTGSTPPPYVAATTAAGASAPIPAPAGKGFGGLAIAAIVVSGIAFLSGWVPIFGALLGLAGGLLGVFALLRGQSRPISVISMVLSGLALLTSIGITIALALGGATGVSSSTSNSSAAPAPIPSAVEASPSQPTPTPTPTPTVIVIAVDTAAFALEAHGHVEDINKDLDDMVGRTVNSQMIRLLGNTIELSFNLAQLRVLDVPEEVAADWSPALNQLEAAIDSTSEAAGDYSAGSITAEAMLAAIESTRAQAAAVDAIISRVG